MSEWHDEKIPGCNNRRGAYSSLYSQTRRWLTRVYLFFYTVISTRKPEGRHQGAPVPRTWGFTLTPAGSSVWHEEIKNLPPHLSNMPARDSRLVLCYIIIRHGRRHTWEFHVFNRVHHFLLRQLTTSRGLKNFPSVITEAPSRWVMQKFYLLLHVFSFNRV